jgi:starvation-inducible DNA-binding protein
MYKTKNDLPEATRTNVIDLLNGRLADSIDLMLQTKQAHWNVKGPNFIALHEFFDAVADKVTDYVDLIAERITQLGGIAEGTVAVVAQRSTLSDYPLTIADGKDHVEALSTALAAFGKLVRRASAEAEEWQDRDTADLLTEVSRGIDKQLWFLEAHLQSKSGTRMAVAHAKDPLR